MLKIIIMSLTTFPLYLIMGYLTHDLDSVTRIAVCLTLFITDIISYTCGLFANE
jgi:hypothetical protein